MRFQIQVHQMAETAVEMSILLMTYTLFDLKTAEDKLTAIELKPGQCAALITGRDVIKTKFHA